LSQVNRFHEQVGEPYDYLGLIDKMPIPDIIDLVDVDIAETAERWIHPTINITYQHMAEAGNRKVNNLKAQRKSLESIMKSREAVAAKQAEIKAKTPEPPEPQKPANIQMIDYRRPLLISMGIFTALMLLLIWRIK